MQIALRAGERLMSHVGRQHWQLGIEVCALTIPTQKAMDSKGVANVVDARSLASSGMRNAALEQQLPE